ncbi:MAG TPA: Wzz/FepE/Etk N-terminal domain-containing protein [Chloroflexia bacterium]|nr:Wzz/FepE/Etk N-terminal domain-containing protein [Chloroflexia bacterium]
MELRQYIAVVRRRWPLVAIIVVLSALFSLSLLLTQKPTYTAFVRLSMRQQSLPAQTPAAGQPGFFTYDNYYNWVSSEYASDDYTQIVPSQAFAARVLDKLKAQYPALSVGAVQGALAADRKQRELTISAATADSGLSVAIARAAGQVLTDMSVPTATTPNTNGVAIHDNILFAVLDEPAGAASNQARQRLNAALAVAVGLALGLALAFLLEYLDNSLRDSADAERVTGLPVLGAIPGPR